MEERQIFKHFFFCFQYNMERVMTELCGRSCGYTISGSIGQARMMALPPMSFVTFSPSVFWRPVNNKPLCLDLQDLIP